MDTIQKASQLYQTIRKQTEDICQPLEVEDYVIQGIEDVSPPKWHLAHTSWFFETFIIKPNVTAYIPYEYAHLYNSYYQTLNKPYPRADRGLLARPTVKDIYAYRQHVDQHILDLLTNCPGIKWAEMDKILEIGIQHEQQHQELLFMDIKYNYALHAPHFPIYSMRSEEPVTSNISSEFFIPVDGGKVSIGYSGAEFSYDNEQPQHTQWLNPFSIANRLVTNREYLEFIEANSYKNPALWLSDGWECVQKNKWNAPLYWYRIDNEWFEFTLHGLIPLNLDQPVCHVSYYEADAYSRWKKKRLPTEIEWEHFTRIAQLDSNQGNFLEQHHCHPIAGSSNSQFPQQFFGDVWEWTMSPYSPYPGYKAYDGKLSEYNGKFMCNQLVLRGGSCVTPSSHIRATYRNFFQPDKRWQFSGFRLAMDGHS